MTAPHTLGRGALDNRDGGKNLGRYDGIHDRCAELHTADDHDERRYVATGRKPIKDGRESIGGHGERLDGGSVVRPRRLRVQLGRDDHRMPVLVEEVDAIGYALAYLKGCHDSYPFVGKQLDMDAMKGQDHDDSVVMVPPVKRRTAMVEPFMESHCNAECSTAKLAVSPFGNYPYEVSVP